MMKLMPTEPVRSKSPEGETNIPDPEKIPILVRYLYVILFITRHIVLQLKLLSLNKTVRRENESLCSLQSWHLSSSSIRKIFLQVDLRLEITFKHVSYRYCKRAHVSNRLALFCNHHPRYFYRDIHELRDFSKNPR